MTAEEQGGMVTHILMALAAAAVALLAGLTGGLPSPPPRRHPRALDHNRIASASELVSQTVCATDTVRSHSPKTPRPNRVITVMVCAIAALVGALSAESFWLATRGCDQLKLQGAVGNSLAERTTMVRLLRFALAMQAPSDTAPFDSHDAKVATPSVAVAVISEPPPPAHEMRALRRSPRRTRSMETPVALSGYATHSSRGTWLFLPNANGGPQLLAPEEVLVLVTLLQVRAESGQPPSWRERRRRGPQQFL
jgi:hypothetical protein